MADVIRIGPVAAKVVAPARMAKSANIVIVFMLLVQVHSYLRYSPASFLSEKLNKQLTLLINKRSQFKQSDAKMDSSQRKHNAWSQNPVEPALHSWAVQS